MRLPLLQGVAFAAVSSMIGVGLAGGGGTPGLQAILVAVVAGLISFLVAPFFAKLIRLFPPVVTGTVITIIGVVLLSVAALDAGGGGSSQYSDPPTFGALPNLGLAFFTLAVILALYRFFTGFLATVAVLIGLVVGAIAGAVFGWPTSAASPMPPSRCDDTVLLGVPTFDAAAIISEIVIIMLITMVEDHQERVRLRDRRQEDRKDDVARAIRADGLSTTLGGILNSFPTPASRERRTGPLTGVRSRWSSRPRACS